MVFSSATFLFYFLPLVLLIHFLLKKTELRNIFLLFASLFFYAWGESYYILIMLLSILTNYCFGLVINYANQAENRGNDKRFLLIGVAINLTILIYYKYFNFLFENIQSLGLFEEYINAPVHLPIGISFFTFQSISYLIDIYYKKARVQRNPLNLGLYIALFPQLIAGPIIRYHDVTDQIKTRFIGITKFSAGISRFIFGLSKKILIADPLARIADEIFLMNPLDIPTEIAWLGIICYSLQIYFDFSGYSDMAIGLGKMLGFDFLENFNYPYISKSIQEFWRRWHISLSNWFRDYLYIPLGGNRIGTKRTYVNLFLVFLTTGLWHGASWNFIVWGLFHGLFLIIERIGFKSILDKLPKFIRHTYTLLIVIIGWVFFKSVDLSYSIGFLKALIGYYNGWDYKVLINFDNLTLGAFAMAILISMPIFTKTFSRFSIDLKNPMADNVIITSDLKGIITWGLLMLLLITCIFQIASNSYSPFIYFRF